MTIKLPVIKAHISFANIKVLEEKFATLTEHGWVIPEWLVNLKHAKKTGGPVITFTLYVTTLNELRDALRVPRVTKAEYDEYYDEWCGWKISEREWSYGNIRNQLVIARVAKVSRT